MTERWKVDYVTLHSRDSYFESDCQYEFRVVDTATGEVVYRFWRDEFDNSEGSRDRGAKEVTIAEDGRSVTVLDEDGSSETHPLPPLDHGN